METLTPALLADALKPYVAKWIDESKRATLAATGSGSGTQVHDLGGPLHNGTLRVDQAPWALLTDGSRVLAGNLTVNAGITIDGIDISAHAANVNAHHNQAHAYDSTDHTGSLSWSKVDKTGSNLSDLASRPHSQLTNIGANDHHAQSHAITGGDHTVTGAQWNVVGLTGTNTLGLILPVASTIGPLEKILKSDSAGGLELVKLRTATIDSNTGQSLTLQPANAIVLAPGNNLVTLNDGKALQSVSFTSGFAGAGFRVDQGVAMASKTTMETDNLVVRGTLSVYELLIHQIRATNGSVFISATGKVKTVSGTGPYTITTDPEHGFLVGDLIRAQRWTGTGVYQSDLEVTGVTDTYAFTATKTSGVAPAVGYEYVRLGSSSNANRRGGIYLTADDSGAPFIDVFNDVDAFTDWNTTGIVKARLGKLDGITSGTNEYGLIVGNSGWGDTGQWLKVSSAGAELHNVPIKLYNGSTQTANINAAGTDIWIGPSSSDKRLTWDGSALTVGAVATGNVYITGGNVSVRNATTERIGLTSAGVLTVKDSGGAAVFTFDAAVGAEFTKPLTIGASGGIYQGTGTFASPTTGLKIWNSGGVGLIAGYNATVAQWYATTAGTLAAGAGQVILDAAGIGVGLYPNLSYGDGVPTEGRSISWWSDPTAKSGSPTARMYVADVTSGFPYWKVVVNPGGTLPPSMMIWDNGTVHDLWLTNINSVTGFPSFNANNTGGGVGVFNITGNLEMSGTITAANHMLPQTDITYNLGSAAKRWNTIYGNNLIISGSISGSTLGGAEWEYAGSMVIDANSASATTVSVVNQGAGTASLDVEGNITLGGTVDGVDIASHAGNANAHHSQGHSYDSTDHTGSLSWSKIDKTGSNLTDIATRAHGSLSGIGANDHHNQSHVLATTTALGGDHTVSGLTARQVLRATGATTATFSAIEDADLPSTIVRTGRTITAGAGLTGGGDLTADRTLTVGAGTLITVNADDVALSAGTAQYQVPVTGATPFTPAYALLSSFAGDGLAFSSNYYVELSATSGLELTGTSPAKTLQLADSVAGDGLTVANKVLSVSVSGLGLSVSADAVVLASSANPGAAASILASSISGYLQLTRLGIGVAPTVELDVSGAIKATSTISALSYSASSTSPYYIWNDTDGATDQKNWDFVSSGTNLILRAVNDAYSTANDVMRITRSGYTISSISFDTNTLYVDAVNNRVGIGTTSPRGTFDVNGNIYVKDYGQIQITSAVDATGLQLLAVAGSYAMVGTIDSIPLIFRTASTERARISNLGYFGINRADPAYPLDVSGNARITGDLYVDGGMVDLAGSGIIDFGTDSIVEDAINLKVMGAKPLLLAQTVSATSWSMTTAGVLAAASAGFTGGATFGSDVTVGSNVLNVNVAGTRVGINCAADAQFDLDVAGPIRGTYLVGKHAIQLSAAAAVIHFDGPEPSALLYTGSNASHLGVNGTETGGVIYRPGKFGKAIQIAEATVNLCVNPQFYAGTTGHTQRSTPTTFARSTDEYYIGVASLHVVTDAAGDGWYYIDDTNLAASTQYTLSVQLKGSGTVRLCMYDGVGGWQNGSAITLTSSWTRYSFTATLGSGTGRRVSIEAVGAVADFYLDAVQIEAKAYATPYADGTLGTGHTWSGTEHASTSARAEATLTYPTTLLAASAGTVMAWIFNAGNTGGSQVVLRATGSTAGHIILRSDTAGAAALWGTGSLAGSAVPVGDWHHIAMTYDGTTLRLYQNGVQTASGAASGFAGMPTAFGVGSFGTTQYVNGLIDDLVITNSALDSDLIRAIYESGAPVFVESSVAHWRSPGKVPIWVDEFGLWAQGVSGGAVLGVYGGDPRGVAAYKTWGGINLEENDVLIGRSTGGYLHWDDSAGQLYVKGSISADAGYLGTLSVTGSLTLADSTGRIMTAGVTGYASGTGVFIGWDAINHRFRVGTPGSKYLQWDGSNLSWAGVNTSLTTAGLFTASNAVIAGNVTATTGAIGGWTLGATSLTAGSGATTVGVDSGGTNPAFYAGSATPASAPFRVTNAGVVTMTSGDISGSITIGAAGKITTTTASNANRIDITQTNIDFYTYNNTGLHKIRWLDGADVLGTLEPFYASVGAGNLDLHYTGKNWSFWGNNSTTTNFGSGSKVIHIHNATTAPTGNATNGGILYVESGALKYRGSSGTVTTLGPA